MRKRGGGNIRASSPLTRKHYACSRSWLPLDVVAFRTCPEFVLFPKSHLLVSYMITSQLPTLCHSLSHVSFTTVTLLHLLQWIQYLSIHLFLYLPWTKSNTHLLLDWQREFSSYKDFTSDETRSHDPPYNSRAFWPLHQGALRTQTPNTPLHIIQFCLICLCLHTQALCSVSQLLVFSLHSALYHIFPSTYRE